MPTRIREMTIPHLGFVGGLLYAVRKAGRAPPEPPEYLRCPITQELFHDPVIWVDGHSYERDAIARWLRNSEKSPMTGERHRGARDVLLPNHAMRSQVEEWRGQHPNARIGRPRY